MTLHGERELRSSWPGQAVSLPGDRSGMLATSLVAVAAASVWLLRPRVRRPPGLPEGAA
ncbi:MAG TPA: hypothetical protein VFR63_14975 [Gaiellaceae bacterium]|nr:hypothetical protein [Gaiellaceae bacterium]